MELNIILINQIIIWEPGADLSSPTSGRSAKKFILKVIRKIKPKG